MSEHFLAPEIFAGENANHMVFLDLKRNRYVALSPDDAKLFRSLVATEYSAGRAVLEDSQVEELSRTMETEGLLVRDPSKGKIFQPLSLSTLSAEAWTDCASWPRLRIGHVANFFRAWLYTIVVLKFLPLSTVVNRVRRRKEKRAGPVTRALLDDARVMTRVFLMLQPMFFSPHDICLRSSLTLVEFLSFYGIYPMWVFGVQVQPFAAHCWVQIEDELLNDGLFHVKGYTPLMVV